ncbi:MAG: HlyD family efflux transporter periplasmic adaptor subunit [Gammaproteobacteria bacterium]|nr:HlyD family efflux transporter periplasmic adaptor subunit [Gammaproteobacteria bacterium]
MNIQFTSSKLPRKHLLVTTVALLALCAAGYSLVGQRLPKISRAKLELAQVKQGKLEIYAHVYGELASRQERLLTAPAQGKVAEIVQRPGTKVKPDTIILRLSNPQLEQELNKAKGALAKAKAEKAKFSFELQNTRLDAQSKIADAEAALAKAKLELKVNKELMARGIAASLDMQKADLEAQLQTKRLKFEKDKYQQLIDIQSFQQEQNDILVSQEASQVALLQQQLKDMQISAGIAGSLQALEISLGESVQLGQSLAKVGSDETLIAKLRIPQRKADLINQNAHVIIDTQKGQIPAHISRIETLVNDGVVIAEARLDGPLTNNARPALSISAKVFIEEKTQIEYVRQLPGLKPNTTQEVLILGNNQIAKRKSVKFGDLSEGKLVLLAGAATNETLLTSYEDLSAYSSIVLIDDQ